MNSDDENKLNDSISDNEVEEIKDNNELPAEEKKEEESAVHIVSEPETEASQDDKEIKDVKEVKKATPVKKKPSPKTIRPEAKITPINSKSQNSELPLDKKTIMVMSGALLVLILIIVFFFAPPMRVSKITVVGNQHLTAQEIIAQGNLDYGNHIFAAAGRPSLGYGYLEKSLKATNPYIEKINISVKFPGQIVINVTERNKIAYIRTPDGYAAIDANGIVLELCSDFRSDVRPLICGIDVDNVVLGRNINITDSSSYQKMIIVLGAILASSENSTTKDEYNFFENVLEIRTLTSGYFFVTVMLPEGSTLQIKFNSTDNITQDMDWLMYAIESGSFEDLPDGVLDMTGEEYIYREYQ